MNSALSSLVETDILIIFNKQNLEDIIMNFKKIKAGVIASILLFSLGAAIPAAAETVYYKGTRLSWDHGRDSVVNSYSKLQSSVYEHATTANTKFSGWKSKGQLAEAKQYVGISRAYAYWNAR